MYPFGLPLFWPLAFVAGLLAPAQALELSDFVWPDTPAARQAAQEAVEALNAELLAQASATATLERWCAAHGIAARGEVRAERVREAEGPAPEAIRAQLGVAADTPVRHRHVRLRCGATVLSEADNYYVPERLSPQMNTALDTTDTPFGKVVRPLDFRRRTLEAELLWRPAEMPAAGEAEAAAQPQAPAQTAAETPQGAGRLAMPAFVLTHRAVLSLPDGRPFSALIERYTSGVLSYPPPR